MSKKKQLSKAGSSLLCRISGKSRHSALIGDFEEIYSEIAGNKGVFSAKLWYWGQILRSLPSYLMFSLAFWSAMFKNYFLTSIRYLKRYKAFSFINISGLAIGMACFLLIFLYVKYEFSYDKFHKDSQNIYRIIDYNDSNNSKYYSWYIAAGVGPAMEAEYPGYVSFTRTDGNKRFVVKSDNELFTENAVFADNSFFDIFSFSLMRGNEKFALKEPNSVVISQKMAAKFFKDEDPVGKQVSVFIYEKPVDLKVTGILDKVNSHSHLKFDFLLSFKTHESLDEKIVDINKSWNKYCSTFIKVSDNFDEAVFHSRISSIIKKYGNEDYKKMFVSSHLQPVSDIHIRPYYRDTDTVKYNYMFLMIAVIILSIACINFTNLSTARSSIRTKEVGVRKVIGAYKSQLIKQFIGESMILSFIALVFALVVVAVILPTFNSVVDRNIELNIISDPVILLVLAGIVVFTGIVSGIYPALFLSSFKPVKTLKGVFKEGTGSSRFRNILVVGQFSISIILILFTMFIQNQMNFIKTADVGFDKKNVLSTWLTDSNAEKSYPVIKRKLLENPEVISVSTTVMPIQSVCARSFVTLDGPTDKNERIMSGFLQADYDFQQFFNTSMISGRFFSKEYNDKKSAVVNETFVKRMGVESPLNKKFVRNKKVYEIIGVIKDFHIASLHVEIAPLAIVLISRDPWNVYARIKPGNVKETTDFIRNTINEYSPSYPVKLEFLEDSINDMYTKEQRLGTIFKVFSALAIFIACLGLFGLASFTVERRNKEIGIRKVLGSNISGLVMLISRNFLILVLIANFIAWPVTFYLVKFWLRNFAYHAEVGMWTFISGGILALLIAFFTTGYQAIKAARSNPVDTLRYE